MPGPQAIKVVVPENLRADLLRASTMERGSHRDVVRARIVLLADQGLTNSEIAAKAGCTERNAYRERWPCSRPVLRGLAHPAGAR